MGVAREGKGQVRRRSGMGRWQREEKWVEERRGGERGLGREGKKEEERKRKLGKGFEIEAKEMTQGF